MFGRAIFVTPNDFQEKQQNQLLRFTTTPLPNNRRIKLIQQRFKQFRNRSRVSFEVEMETVFLRFYPRNAPPVRIVPTRSVAFIIYGKELSDRGSLSNKVFFFNSFIL